ncbi:MAG: radical SAM protein [Candidatus Firestonebacteria bacterium]
MLPMKNINRNLRKAMLEPAYAFKAFLKRSKAYLKYLFNERGESIYPEAVTFFLTFKCNLRCYMCGQWGDSGCNKNYDSKKLNDEIPLEKLISFLDEIKLFNPHITLFGGEPLLFGHIEKLIKEIKNRNLHCCIITNGVLLERYAETIVNSQVDELSISIDGPEYIHDQIRNVKGTYERIKKGVEKINQLKKEKSQKFPIINIVCTISEKNYGHLEEMIDVTKQINANTLNFHHLIFTEESTLKRHNKLFKECFNKESDDWAGYILPGVSKIKTDILCENIKKIQREKLPFLMNFYPNFTDSEIIEYYTKEDFVSKSYPKRCLSPWVVAYIYPDGSVLPCHSLSYTVGNIKEESFLNIWNGEKFKYFRKKLKKEKYFPICPKCTEMYRY